MSRAAQAEARIAAARAAAHTSESFAIGMKRMLDALVGTPKAGEGTTATATLDRCHGCAMGHPLVGNVHYAPDGDGGICLNVEPFERGFSMRSPDR